MIVQKAIFIEDDRSIILDDVIDISIFHGNIKGFGYYYSEPRITLTMKTLSNSKYEITYPYSSYFNAKKAYDIMLNYLKQNRIILTNK